MKICPKCRYLDHEESGPNYECPMCGVIYSRAIDKINEEKIKYNEQQFEKTWAKIKKAPEKAFSTFWIWAGLTAIVAIISGINIQKNMQYIKIPTGREVDKTINFKNENFQTKFEMRTKEVGECSFKIISNDAPNTIFILLDHATREKIVLVYVKRGDEIELKVPPGDYSFQMIQGEIWLGEKEHFGLNTTYLDGQKIITFEKNERGASGNIVKLKTIDGNLKTKQTERIVL